MGLLWLLEEIGNTFNRLKKNTITLEFRKFSLYSNFKLRDYRLTECSKFKIK